MLLDTPLGEIEVKLDDLALDYKIIEVPLENTCEKLSGRFCIEVDYVPDGKMHKIGCLIKNYVASPDDEIESGERLELYSFYKDGVKLSIGMEADGGYTCEGDRFSVYDYDYEYLKNGVQYIILPDTKTHKYKFGVAWINNENDTDDVQTWYGADPTLFNIREG